MKVKEKLLNKISLEKKGYASKLAEIAGYSSGSNFNKMLKKETGEFPNVPSALKTFEFAFPHEDIVDLMSQYALEINPNWQLARQFLEYVRINKLDELTDKLIDKLINCSNNESKEWATIYKIDREVSKGSITPHEAIKEIDKTKVETIEMEVFSQIVQFYNYFDVGLINHAEEFYQVVINKIEMIDNEYIKNSYLNRLELMRCEVALHKDDQKLARKHALVAAESAPNTLKCFLYLRLGNSYIFESFDKSLEYLKKAKEYAEEIKAKSYGIQVKRSLNFLHNYWEKIPKHLILDSNEISDLHEVAFYYIRQGNITMGLKVLDGIEFENLNNLQKGFHCFYRGLATGNDDFYYNSIEYFKLAGEKFYRKAPLIELQKLGVKPAIISALSV